MKYIRFFIAMLSVVFAVQVFAATPPGLPVAPGSVDPFAIPPSPNGDPRLRASGDKPIVTNIDVLGTKTETRPFTTPQNIYALAVSGDAGFLNTQLGSIKVILIDNSSKKEYLVYESYPDLTVNSSFSVSGVCEESCLLPLIASFSLRIEVVEAYIRIQLLEYADIPRVGDAVAIKAGQNAAKIQKLNESNLGWVAGETSVSMLTYEEKKRLFLEPKVPNLQGFEFYAGGIFDVQSSSVPPAVSADNLVSAFDWRSRHGENWVTSVKNQSSCGSCWAFATTAALEGVANVYFNQHLNLDLAEQDALSCSGAGSCQGGWPSGTFDFFKTTGIVNEACFAYLASDLSCSSKCGSPTDKLKISGRYALGGTQYPRTAESIKRMIIETGPVSGIIWSLSHAMNLVGFTTDPADNRTVWIFKNSWGANWGGALDSRWGAYYREGSSNQGYAYIKLALDNMDADAIQSPVLPSRGYTVNCADRDNDTYCNWGVGTKPSTCPASCAAQRDCDDSNPSLGPFDSGYRCTLNNNVVETKQFNVYNEGSADLTVTSITPESPVAWLTVMPTNLAVPTGQSRSVSVQVNKALVPSGGQNVRLQILSNDPDENPYPGGITVTASGGSALQSDSDTDGYTDAVELQAGANPFDATNTPPGAINSMLSQCATYNPLTIPQVRVPCVNVGGSVYSADLTQVPGLFRFTVTGVQPATGIVPNADCAAFPYGALGTLRFNCLRLGMDKYWVDMNLVSHPTAIQFDVGNFGKN